MTSLVLNNWAQKSNDSVSELWRPCSDLADGLADLRLHCPHIPEDIFLHGVAHTVYSATWSWLNIL